MAVSEYDARTIKVTMSDPTSDQNNAQRTLEDIDTIGYDQSKTHEIQKALTGENYTVKGIGEYSGTFSFKAVSDNVDFVQTIFDENHTFEIEVFYPDGGQRHKTTFENCKVMDYAPGDYELEGFPAYEADWECPFVSHVNTAP